MSTNLHPYALKNVVPQLDGLLGARLETVVYRTLQHETEADHIADEDFYLGAEVELTFDAGRRLYVSWDQRVPYGQDFAFGLLLARECTFSDDVITPYDATGIPIWRRHIGCTIDALKIYGFHGAPFTLCLLMATGSVYIGSASQTKFGDGDDVFITDDISDQQELHLVWELSPKVG